jgi:hypothetical protein
MKFGVTRAVTSFCAAIAVAATLSGCAKTISGGSPTTAQEKGRYFTVSSENEQTIYFEKVKKHFQEIGRQISESEVRQYTASIFILSVPPAAEVFDEGSFVGKTNASQLYFKPGRHQITIKKGDRENQKELELVEGKNLSIVVKL